MLKKIILQLIFLVFIFGYGDSHAQGSMEKEDLELIRGYEHDMVLITDSLYHAPIVDIRSEYCEQLVKLLVKSLRLPGSYSYPFEKLGEKINIIAPDDNTFRIFNWSMLNTEVTLRYYGAIQMNSAQLKLYPLVDISGELNKSAEDTILSGGKWFGALYYRIMAHELDGQQVYTLFGVNKGGVASTRKVMDLMHFSPEGPVFGGPAFQVRNENGTFSLKNRFVMEYKKEVQASLNWDDEKKVVYFDRLISQVNDPNRKYTFVPSGQYDGFRWRDGRWNMIEDLIPILQMKDGEAPISQPKKKKKE